MGNFPNLKAIRDWCKEQFASKEIYNGGIKNIKENIFLDRYNLNIGNSSDKKHSDILLGIGVTRTDNNWYSISEGYYTTVANMASASFGMFNKEMATGKMYNDQIGDLFVLGNGYGYSTDTATKSNALRITQVGEILGTQQFQSSGADYAEFLKPWGDNNEEEEDRVGYFVTVKNGFLYKADEGDYICGITSGNPSVVGNGDEDYYWRYERDVFNRIVMEDVPEMIQKTNEEGIPLWDEETHEPILEETGNIIPNARMKLADDYDPSLQNSYVERKYRKEWDYVGMLGIIPVRDDGTCEAGRFCKCGQGGIATLAEERGFDTYMVIERIADNVVSVLLK